MSVFEFNMWLAYFEEQREEMEKNIKNLIVSNYGN